MASSRLRLVETQVRAAFQFHAALDQFIYLLFQPELRKHFPRASIAHQFVFLTDRLQQPFDFFVRGFVRDINLVDAVHIDVAQKFDMRVRGAVNEVAHFRVFICFQRGKIDLPQIFRFVFQLAEIRRARVCAHDQPAALESEFFRAFQKAFALLFLADLARNAQKGRGGKINEVFPHKGYVHAQPRALGPHGGLGHLHHHFVADLHVQTRVGICGGGLCGHIARVQIAVFRLPETDERRLHSVEHVHDPSLVNVARNFALVPRIEMKLDEFVPFGQRRETVVAEVVKVHIPLHLSKIPARRARR